MAQPPPRLAAPFLLFVRGATLVGGSYDSMSKYKKFLPVMFILSWLAAPANAGQGGGTTDSALEPSAVERCAQLATAKSEWPDATTRIERSAWRADGSQVAIPMAPPVTLPAHCELTGVMQERVGVDGQHYAIHFHLRLPMHWNGKILFRGWWWN